MGRHRQFDENDALESALAVFWQKGYEGTSLDDLTQATGVARPGLYSAFGNKEQLFLKALDLYEAKYMGFMLDALKAATSRLVVERILNGSASLQTRNSSHLGCLGINGALACSEDAENIRCELIRRRTANEAALINRFEKARQEGDLAESQDCKALASFIMVLSQGMAVQAKAGVSRKTLNGMIEHALATWPSPAVTK
ncbi:TetR/AcrR family transcriptional regulator [Erwinia sp. 9145]|uniref:TetR/AcrR family transcriptional regulator n=1 Tax=Erwinia sp. 9145 TaxID=1500895 RepID=UPI0005554755|nr:TetR/AcrR family transcriptional regulator [Erwinia sp. 9145]